MSIEAVKSISIRTVIETETGLQFRRNKLIQCPFCNSGNNGSVNSDSAFSINERSNTNYFKCFSCEAGGTTIDFVMRYKNLDTKASIAYLEQNYLGKIDIERNTSISTPEVIVPDYIPKDLVDSSVNTNSQNNFKQWLIDQYGEVAITALQEYQVGTSSYRKGATVFFFIDETKQVRRGKIMQFNPLTGRRERSLNPTWVHSILGLKNKPEQCLFGIHLASKYPDKTVAVVESEKTAIFMSIIAPDYLWMATGGLSNLKAEYFKPLKSRNIILFPDLGEAKNFGTPYEEWKRKLPEIRKYVDKIVISDLLERKCIPEQRIDGYDLADYFINRIQVN